MSEPLPGQDSLVLYKTRPARVTRAGTKLEIVLEGGESVKVRPKDVVLLHPGPIQGLGELGPLAGDVETAWELLAGSTTTLAEAAELIYGAYTPPSAWATWQLVEDGLYFYGTPPALVARTAQDVAVERAARQARAAREQAWRAFLERVRTGHLLPSDDPYLKKVEDLALGRSTKSELLRELGRAETPESAHALLLELGYWDDTVDPYPTRLGLPTPSPEVEVTGLPEEVRSDLTHLPAFAIDDEGNQEPDDALSLEDGRLWVHVADVASIVTPDSSADLEARARGASLFLPEGTVPMLPWEAVRRLGLGLAEISPALSFGLDLDPAGGIADLEIVPSWIRVTRLVYEEAEARLAEEPFRSLWHLARIRRARREAQGALSMDLPEIKIRIQDGEVLIHPIPSLRSRELVTEAMLMAGEAIANFASQQGIPIPFTTQDPPESDERPTDLAGMYALRRVLRPGQPSSIPGPHAGLGLPAYAQATSPLRRYLDLVVHQQLRAHLRGEGLLGVQDLLERIGATEAAVGSVRQAERLARRHWTLVYLMRHPGWRGNGVLVDNRWRQATVLIPELDFDARVYLRQDLPLNSQLHLALRAVSLPTLETNFEVVA